MADGTVAVDRKARLAALLAQAVEAEAEADSAVTPEDAEEAAAVERIEGARRRRAEALATVRRATLAQHVERLRKVANSAYVVDPFDMEETAPGAGSYVLRSPSRDVLKVFREACEQSNGNQAAVDRAYTNLCAKVILWTDAPEESDAWVAHCAKYPALIISIGDAAGRLGGVAAQARKR